jgi:hypothetical protein
MVVTLIILAVVFGFAFLFSTDISGRFALAILFGVGLFFALAAHNGWIIVA